MYSELVEKIMKLAEESGVDLQSLGIYDDEELIIYALKFMLNHVEDLDEEFEEPEEDEFFLDLL